MWFIQRDGFRKCGCTRLPVSVSNSIDSPTTQYASIDTKAGKEMLTQFDLALKKPTTICGQDMTCFVV